MLFIKFYKEVILKERYEWVDMIIYEFMGRKKIFGGKVFIVDRKLIYEYIWWRVLKISKENRMVEKEKVIGKKFRDNWK